MRIEKMLINMLEIQRKFADNCVLDFLIVPEKSLMQNLKSTTGPMNE